VPGQEGDERPQSHYNEEREASNSGRMSHMWDEDVQDWEELKLILKVNRIEKLALDPI
jgi:cytidylate kinase